MRRREQVNLGCRLLRPLTAETTFPTATVLNQRRRSSNNDTEDALERSTVSESGTSRRLSRIQLPFARQYRRHTGASRCIRGFDNLGNTCYMNSALQCLAATRLLSEYFYQRVYNRHSEGCHGRMIPAFEKLGPKELTECFEQLIMHLRESTDPSGVWRGNPSGSSVNLSSFKAIVEQRFPQFEGYDQHDAQEFLALFLDAIHEELNRAVHNRDEPPPVEPTINNAMLEANSFKQLAAQAWKRYLMRNKSFFVDLFQGQLVSSITCGKCDDVSLKFEPFMFLSLPLRYGSGTSTKICSIEEALEAFSSAEQLAGPVWKCPNCLTKVPAEKQMRLVALPPVLILHLKRFEFTSTGFRKIESRIASPIQGLDLTEYVATCRGRPVYDLFATIDHSGSAECGHYTANCCRDGKWYCFDDSIVNEINDDQVISRGNYVLFYERRDSPREPDLVRRQTLRRPEDWPHNLRTDVVEYFKRKL